MSPINWTARAAYGRKGNTDNFNGYLALFNFSNFTTKTNGTPNTRFFMGTMVQIAPHQIHVFFLPFNFEKRQLPIFFLPNFEKKP